ncbi:MAG: hypothetical protein BGO54_16910 [Sphingobacteriales bacterium 46-32]|nr:MAG: hypothetical protein BGO54_16910 [Sphingobacteriales bacterium 46-32]
MLLRSSAIVLFLPIIVLLNGRCNLSSKSKDTPLKEVEGYVELSNQLFEKTDSNGSPINLAGGDTASLFNNDRRLIIWKHFLIDVVSSRLSDESGYLRTDTVGYTFYDLDKQSYIWFDKLSLDASVTRKGKMSEPGGFFSKTAQVDPFNSIADSTWTVSASVLDGKKISIVNFIPYGGEYDEYASRARVWVDMEIQNFPLQLSYILSEKIGNGFVYKMQFAVPESSAVMVTSLKYQQAKLDDTMIAIFKAWSNKVD